ncbi:MAG: hypothetical protein CL678_13080 [Bdellovibrionaceae bacterium]|nr:hypothetical protein [Pseudobdellovibrionaceae bacterium]|tara:strand:- start:1643 stop:3079 length:1437 start_codon:yes stop_codon:yes gene_type:complete
MLKISPIVVGLFFIMQPLFGASYSAKFSNKTGTIELYEGDTLVSQKNISAQLNEIRDTKKSKTDLPQYKYGQLITISIDALGNPYVWFSIQHKFLKNNSLDRFFAKRETPFLWIPHLDSVQSWKNLSWKINDDRFRILSFAPGINGNAIIMKISLKKKDEFFQLPDGSTRLLTKVAPVSHMKARTVIQEVTPQGKVISTQAKLPPVGFIDPHAQISINKDGSYSIFLRTDDYNPVGDLEDISTELPKNPTLYLVQPNSGKVLSTVNLRTDIEKHFFTRVDSSRLSFVNFKDLIAINGNAYSFTLFFDKRSFLSYGRKNYSTEGKQYIDRSYRVRVQQRAEEKVISVTPQQEGERLVKRIPNNLEGIEEKIILNFDLFSTAGRVRAIFAELNYLPETEYYQSRIEQHSELLKRLDEEFKDLTDEELKQMGLARVGRETFTTLQFKDGFSLEKIITNLPPSLCSTLFEESFRFTGHPVIK